MIISNSNRNNNINNNQNSNKNNNNKRKRCINSNSGYSDNEPLAQRKLELANNNKKKFFFFFFLNNNINIPYAYSQVINSAHVEKEWKNCC